ncbi:MAG: type II secretion system GspH family protein [Kiritimatiellae bacterium]|nr:type II secretion system GspH family protein [Kiritimatiellia bacterium]
MRERLFFPEPRRGFTLIELLLATAIAVLVGTLAWSLLSTTTRAVGRQAENAQGPRMAVRTMESLRADLSGMFFPTNDEAGEVVLRPTGDELFKFAFCTIRATNRTPDLVWSDPLRVEYALESPTGPLVRIVRSLSGPTLVETNRLLDRVVALSVALGGGDEWTTTWPPLTNDSVSIRAARVSIQIAEGSNPLEADYWIPAGYAVTSRVIRTGAAQE